MAEVQIRNKFNVAVPTSSIVLQGIKKVNNYFIELIKSVIFAVLGLESIVPRITSIFGYYDVYFIFVDFSGIIVGVAKYP